MNEKISARVGDLSFVDPGNCLTLNEVQDAVDHFDYKQIIRDNIMNNYDDDPRFYNGYTYNDICQADTRADNCEESSPWGADLVEGDDVFYFDKEGIKDTVEETLRPLIERAVEEALGAQKSGVVKIEKYHIKHR